jgi:hypothetical protein
MRFGGAQRLVDNRSSWHVVLRVAAEGKKSLRDFPLVRRIGEPLRLQAQRRSAGSPHAARNPGYAPRPCRTRIRFPPPKRSIQKQSPPGASLAGFVFEYWWRRSLPNNLLEPAWILVLAVGRVKSYPNSYPLMSWASLNSCVARVTQRLLSRMNFNRHLIGRPPARSHSHFPRDIS